MSWWESIILGIVQGLTEFLPISSSAHVRAVGPLLPSGGDPGAAFTAIIQIGTGAAVIVYFWRDITRMLGAWFACVLGWNGRSWRARFGDGNPDARLGWWIILGSLPIVIIGVAFKDSIETELRNLWISVVVLVVFGLILGWADRIGSRRRGLETLSGVDAVVLGFAQAAALVPGVSRSGGTISAGLFLGLTREAAARFSFLLAIPAILGSGFYELGANYDGLTAEGAPGIPATVIAALVSFVVGYLVIVWFLRLIQRRSFTPFVVYRIAAAGAIAWLLLANVIPAVPN
ncbi:MAG: undecaprenyl-diphosphate phosphatase [Demequinaceae bacterium]|nr:undecaprenyl-diphosphate phosphatase [Demequinaceae bacterium]